MAANYGGYDYNFVEKNLERFTCTICTKILKDPHLTGCCGQHFCESCFNYWFTKHRKESCPHCRAEGKEFQHFLNKSLKREIDSLRIHCPNKEKGCQWVGEVESLKDHLESDNGCGYVEVECPNKCKVSSTIPLYIIAIYKLKRKEVENHLKKECYLRPYQCEYCGHKDTFRAVTGNRSARYGPQDTQYKVSNKCHYHTCPEYPQPCPNKCGVIDIKRKSIEFHLKVCPEEWVICPNKCTRNNDSRLPTCIVGESRRYEHVKQKNLSKHLKEECKLRPYQCEHCGLKDSYTTVKTHQNVCLNFPLDCPNKCGVKDIKRKDMEDHRSQCPEEPVRCPFDEAGCKEKLVRRELEQHTQPPEQLQKHLLMVVGAYKEANKANEELKKDTAETKKANEELKKNIVEIKKVNEELKKNTAEIQKTNKELKKDTAEIRKVNEKFKKDNADIKKANEELKKDNEAIKKAYKELKKDNTEVKQACKQMEKSIAELKNDNEEMKQATNRTEVRRGNSHCCLC